MKKTKIEDICDILNGFAFKSDKYVKKGIRVIRIANVQKGYIEDNAPVFYPTDFSGMERYMLREGDLLMSLTGNVGRVALIQKEMLPAALNQRVACLRINSDRITKKYLYHILNSDFFEQQCMQASNGVAQKNISTEWLRKYEIPLCSIDEQLKVTEILDGIQNVIDSKIAELKGLDDLVRGRFVELFGDPVVNSKGWEMVELGELTGIGSSKRIFEKEYVSDGIPFYRTKEIVELSKGNTISTELFITEERYAEIKEKYGVPKTGDLLISAVGTIGIIWIVDGENEFYFKDGNLIRVDGSEKFNSVYLKNLLECLIDEYKKRMSVGTAYAALTISGLAKMKVYNAPIELQNQFADFAHQVDKSKFRGLSMLTTIKSAYDQQTFIYP